MSSVILLNTCALSRTSLSFEVGPQLRSFRTSMNRRKSIITPSAYQKRTVQSSTAPQTRPHKSRFTYKVAAAFSAKGSKFDRTKHHFRYDSATQAHWAAGKPVDAREALANKYQSGQDAFFVSSVGGAKGAAAFGVADGVGGYIDQGIDSAAFAHGLCNYMADSATSFPKGFAGNPGKALEPLGLLQTAFERVCHTPAIKGGGSTACLGVADADGCLKVANLGDSGFIQLRLNAVHYYSFPQTHAFNTPFQLSTVPPKVLAQMKSFGGPAPFCDMPEVASITQHELRHGDVLIFGTDGVWDNISPQEILEKAAHDLIDTGAWTMRDGEGVQISSSLSWLTEDGAPSTEGAESMPIQSRLALNITEFAKRTSLDTKRDGPFAKAVQREFPNERWHGGKMDDIAVVVIIAVDEEAAKLKAKL